jgi:hypothetical protein
LTAGISAFRGINSDSKVNEVPNSLSSLLINMDTKIHSNLIAGAFLQYHMPPVGLVIQMEPTLRYAAGAGTLMAFNDKPYSIGIGLDLMYMVSYRDREREMINLDQPF